MSRSRKMLIAMAILSPIFIYIIYFTNAINYIAPRVDYVRLKNGKEFRNVPMTYPSDIDVVIDGERYTIYDIDSLVQ